MLLAVVFGQRKSGGYGVAFGDRPKSAMQRSGRMKSNWKNGKRPEEVLLKRTTSSRDRQPGILLPLSFSIATVLGRRAGLMTKLTDSIAKLKQFADELSKRPDISVEILNINPPAPPKDVALAREQCEELGDLYALMNGAEIKWCFHSNNAGEAGHMLIPPAKEAVWRESQDYVYMSFDRGPSQDRGWPMPDGWDTDPERFAALLRKEKTSGEISVGFDPQRRATVPVCSTIAEYLELALANAFVWRWPEAITIVQSYECIERFMAPPQVPGEITPGCRAQFKYFGEGGRGEVLQVAEVPDAYRVDTSWALVEFDEGTIGWIPEKGLFRVRVDDSYEKLRSQEFFSDGESESNPGVLLAEIHRAIGPVSHYSMWTPSNARRAAGILRARPLAVALEWVIALYESALAAGLPFGEPLPLPQTGREFSRFECERESWEQKFGKTFEGLFAGLDAYATRSSAESKSPPDQLVPTSLVDKLDGLEYAKYLHQTVTSDAIQRKPQTHGANRIHYRDNHCLTLPTNHPILEGSGY